MRGTSGVEELVVLMRSKSTNVNNKVRKWKYRNYGQSKVLELMFS